MNYYEKAKLQNRIKAIAIVVGFVIAVVLVVIGINKITSFFKETEPVKFEVPSFPISADEFIGGERLPVTEAKVDICEVIGINELQTIEYKYNAVCKVYDNEDANRHLKYYVAYEGSVILSVPFESINIDYGTDDNKVIKITLPQLKKEASIHPDSLEFIYADTKYKNADAFIEAHKYCEKDLKEKVDKDEDLVSNAKRSTESQVRGFTEPLIEQFYPDYQLEIVWE